MAGRRAENAARGLLKKLGAGDRPPINVRRIAESLGLAVVESSELELGERGQISGLLLRREGRTICVLNKLQSRTRRRFTLAHELGHFLLHPAQESYIDVVARSARSSEGTDLWEIEANAFAAELLMPASLVIECAPDDLDPSFHDDQDKIVELAKTFRVSREAMTFRLMNLGLFVSSPIGTAF